MFKLLELEDFADHSPIINGFDMLKQCTIVGSQSNEQG
jgi:hypothetical protein